jgi:hypothetical protein
MITAVDARTIQAAGITQEDALTAAILRCNDAIADVARNRKEQSIAVTVFRLEQKTLKLLVKDLELRGFTVVPAYRCQDRSVVTIGW